MLVKAVPDEKLCELMYFPTFRCFIVLQCSSIKTEHLSNVCLAVRNGKARTYYRGA